MKKIAVLFLCLISLVSQAIAEPIIIPLGWACASATNLKALNLRKAAYPFDWIITSHNSLCKALVDDFAFFLTDLRVRPQDGKVFDHYVFIYPHEPWPCLTNPTNLDFSSPEWQETISQVKIKYQRRLERFRNVCQGNEKVFFLRTDRVTKKQAVELKSILESKYPTLDFTLIVIAGEEDFKEPWHIEKIVNFYEKNIHDASLWAPFFKELGLL